MGPMTYIVTASFNARFKETLMRRKILMAAAGAITALTVAEPGLVQSALQLAVVRFYG
jgi:hypothetical protein